MAGELDVVVGYSGQMSRDGVVENGVTYFKLSREVMAAVYKTVGDGGFDRNTVGRKKADFTFRVLKTDDDRPELGALYTFALIAGVTEGGDTYTVPDFDARITKCAGEVNGEDDDKVQMLEYEAKVSGTFTLT